MKLKFPNHGPLRTDPSPAGAGEGGRRPGEGSGENLNIAERVGASHNAFTLMEVMIAVGVFCIGVFAILSLVANVLHGARLFNKPMVDGGVVASEIANTNQLVEVQYVSGDLGEFLGDQYKGYPYDYAITEEQSNKLFRLDILVHNDAPGKPVVSKMSVLLYRPASPAGSLDPGGMMH